MGRTADVYWFLRQWQRRAEREDRIYEAQYLRYMVLKVQMQLAIKFTKEVAA